MSCKPIPFENSVDFTPVLILFEHSGSHRREKAKKLKPDRYKTLKTQPG